MKIIVAHPGKQHSYRLASALKKEGSLKYYITTFYAKDSSVITRLLRYIARGNNLKRLNSHRNNELNDNDVKVFCELGGLIEILVSRLDSSRNIYRWIHRRVSNRFGVKVAKLAITENVDAVVAYDSNATSCFRFLKQNAPEIVRILDVSSAPRPFLKTVYDQEIGKTGRNDLRSGNQHLWNKRLMSRFQTEIEDTQFFIVPSDYIRKGLRNCGVRDGQIITVPYGANVSSNGKRRSLSEHEQIRFLFVGNATYQKGLPYLLACMKQLKGEALLTITGRYNAKDWFVKASLKDSNIEYTGFITGDKMQKIYEEADVMIVPSFSEGMSQVGIEAMACGLPVICTTNSGVNDLVTEGKNGFVIEPGDQEQLIEKMRWFIGHKERIKEMGANARDVAQDYSWSRYEINVAAALHKILDEKPNQLKYRKCTD